MKANIDQNYLVQLRKRIGALIQYHRKRQQLTQGELANCMGISRTTISKIEDGKVNMGVDTLALFALHLDLQLDCSLFELKLGDGENYF